MFSVCLKTVGLYCEVFRAKQPPQGGLGRRRFFDVVMVLMIVSRCSSESLRSWDIHRATPVHPIAHFSR